MKRTMRLAGVIPVILSCIALTAVPAQAVGTNDGGSIGGLTAPDSVTAGTGNRDCASGFFCVWTGENFTGRKYSLYHCANNYPIYNWLGLGSYQNNNTGGAHARLLDQYGTPIAGVDGNIPTLAENEWWSWRSNADFTPVYSIDAC